MHSMLQNSDHNIHYQSGGERPLHLPVQIIRRRAQKHITLRVYPDGTIRIRCNKSVTRSEIRSFLREANEFIRRQMQMYYEQHLRHPPQRYVDGALLLYGGEMHQLQVQVVAEPKIRLRHLALEKKIVVLCPRDLVGSYCETNQWRESEIEQAVRQFYAEQGRKRLMQSVQYFSQIMPVAPTKVQIRAQRSRWGSCSARGTISLNWLLIAAPPAVLDYVVVHEMAHLLHPNHSKRFWSMVESYCKQYREHQRWLRRNQACFEFLWKRRPAFRGLGILDHRVSSPQL